MYRMSVQISAKAVEDQCTVRICAPNSASRSAVQRRSRLPDMAYRTIFAGGAALFQILELSDALPEGWRLASRREIDFSRFHLTQSETLGAWKVAMLEHGLCIHGSGRGYRIRKLSRDEEVRHKLVVRIPPHATPGFLSDHAKRKVRSIMV